MVTRMMNAFSTKDQLNSYNGMWVSPQEWLTRTDDGENKGSNERRDDDLTKEEGI
jgi:hypothetical protein